MYEKKPSTTITTTHMEIPYEIVCPQCRLTVFHFYGETQFITVYCMPIRNMVYVHSSCMYTGQVQSERARKSERERKRAMCESYAKVNILEKRTQLFSTECIL